MDRKPSLGAGGLRHITYLHILPSVYLDGRAIVVKSRPIIAGVGRMRDDTDVLGTACNVHT